MDPKDRENYRVPAQVKVFYSLDSVEARTAMVTDYKVWAAQPPAMPEQIAQNMPDLKSAPEPLKPIYSMLQWLNFKIDILLYQTRLNAHNNIFSNFLTTSDLSVQGFGFTETINAQNGDQLLLAIHLPDDPVHPLYIVGCLARNAHTNHDPSNHGAITFTEISEADRERIARFNFNYERKLKQQLSSAKA